MSGFLDSLFSAILGLSPALLLLIVGALVFAEDAIFVGFLVPGETAAVLAGVATSFGKVSFPAALAVVVGAAILGDTVGYEVGRHVFGPRILDSGPVAKHRHRMRDAEELLERRGGPAVFLGRFVAFFRAMMPALAGATHLPYRTFLMWNALGGLVWGTIFVTLGHFAGASYQVVEQKVGRGMAAVVVVLVVAVLVARHVLKSRREARMETDADREDPGTA